MIFNTRTAKSPWLLAALLMGSSILGLVTTNAYASVTYATVCFYWDDNYQGHQFCVDGTGNWPWIGDVAHPSWNDQVSSILILGNACVTVYDHANYGGENREFCSDVYSLGQYGMNDRISSFSVTQQVDCDADISVGQSISDNWEASCNSVGRAGRYAKYYTFTLLQPTEVTIDLESFQDTYLLLRAGATANGPILETNDDGGDGYNSRITRQLNAGTYTIEATTYNANTTGSFALSVTSANTWVVNDYGNNENRSQTLSISGASRLYVALSGGTEPNYDYLTVYDETGNQVAHLSGNLDGEGFFVDGSSIDLQFTSDGSVSGYTFSVIISDAS